MSVAFKDLRSQPLFLFIGCAALATAIEWFTGKFLERINYHKWWDYSKKKWNFDGYICLQYSVLWGILGVLAVKYVNNFFISIFKLVPDMILDHRCIGPAGYQPAGWHCLICRCFPHKKRNVCHLPMEQPVRPMDPSSCPVDYQPCGKANGQSLSVHSGKKSP